MKMETNPNNPRPHDIQLIAQGLKRAEPWGLQAEFAWSLATHFKTYPHDTMEMGVQVALDDWDLDGPYKSEGDTKENDYLG